MAARPPVPPDLAALFEKESRGYGLHAATKAASYARVLERVALTASVGVATGAAAHAAAAGVAAGAGKASAGVSVKLLSLVAAGAMVVGVVAGRATAPEPVPVASPSAVVPTPSFAGAPPSVSETPAPVYVSQDADAPLPSASARAAGPPPPIVGRGTLAQERELVEGARAALTRGRAGDALAAADRHGKEFPRGQLAEEREVLAITALIALGRLQEAEMRRARFMKTFPSSLLLPPLVDGGRP